MTRELYLMQAASPVLNQQRSGGTMEWSMLIGGKYEAAESGVEADGWRTFEGREIPSGRAVLVHRLLESQPGAPRPSLAELAGRHGPVIDTCSSDGVEYVVTEALPRGSGELRFTRVGAWRVPESFSAKPAAAPAEPSISGIFSAPPAQEAPAREAAPKQADDPLLPPAPMAPAAAEPGEFTRMFQAQAIVRTPAPTPVQGASEPGEFTRMFKAPVAGEVPVGPATPAPASPLTESPAGEFTQFFQPSLGSTPFKAPTAPVSEPAAPAPPPGEYTRLFQSAAPLVAPPPQSGATGAFVTASSPPPVAPPPANEGPSDFTRMMRSSPPPPVEARPAAPPPAPIAPRAVSRPGVPLALVAFLAALAVIAIGMMLFFALRR